MDISVATKKDSQWKLELCCYFSIEIFVIVGSGKMADASKIIVLRMNKDRSRKATLELNTLKSQQME